MDGFLFKIDFEKAYDKVYAASVAYERLWPSLVQLDQKIHTTWKCWDKI
jgi:hypothetical protein